MLDGLRKKPTYNEMIKFLECEQSKLNILIEWLPS